MNFSLLTPAKIIYGNGTANQIAPILKDWNKRVLFVTGKNHPSRDEVASSLELNGIEYFVQQINGEPTLSSVKELTQFAREHLCEVILAMGGGSVIDSGKAVSALLTNHGDILDYLEVVGAGKSIENPAAKMIAVPTTAGTGSEVTKNAVILVEEQHVKVSLRSELMIPRVALIDPMLSLSLPPQYTASTGMDALTQVVEPFVSNKANQMTDLFCESGIKSARNALLEAYQNGDNLSAREKMSWTSLMGGLALANAGLGAVHGFAAVIGGMFDAPHGDICARLLPIVFEVNCREIQKTSECTKYLSRFIQISRWLVGRDNAGIEDGVYFLSNLAEKLNIPSLSIYGLDSSRIEEIAQKARNASSMKGNPVRLNDDVLIEIMQRAISD